MIRESLNLLGQRARDRVTGVEGVVTSICFDLYGCVMAIVTPPAQNGKRVDGEWYDVKRIEVTGSAVMPAPKFGGAFGDETGPEPHPPMPSIPVR